MILQWNTLVSTRKNPDLDMFWTWKSAIMTRPEPDNEVPRFWPWCYKGVIWVTICIHIYKLRFTPAYNFTSAYNLQLRILLAHNEIDILSINKTKLNETISDNEVNIAGYDIIRRDRITNGGGGVCFYVKSS